MSKLPAKRSLQSLGFTLATAFLAGAAPVTGGEAQQVEVIAAIWCDKAEQVESTFRAHLGDGMALEAALARTNAQAEEPGACVAATAIVVETGTTRRFVAGNQVLAITEFEVHGIVKGGQAVQIVPQVWYAAKVLARLTSL